MASPAAVSALMHASAIAVPSVLSTASVVAFAGAAAQSAFARGALLASGYHIQLLAMSAQLASPGISDQYRECAAFFRYAACSTNSIHGSLPYTHTHTL